MTRTAILLPYPAQQEQIVQIAGVYESLDIMCVERAYTETVAQLGKELELKGCELVIARGVHAQLLRDNVTIPLVEMKVTTQEMGVVICRLKSRLEEEKLTIGLVGYGNMFENTDHYDELFGIHLRKYLVSERSELATSVGLAIQEGCQAIIGGDIACLQAEEMGIPCSKIPAGMESLTNALVEGKEAYSIYVNSQNMEIVVNVAPICIDDRIQGAVLTFQEGRRIIEMDTELHKELYQRGFIANFTVDKFYTNSKETKKLEQDVRKIARYSAPVLIMGEKGAGSEYLAEAIHNASLLKNNAFVPVECDAWMPETLDDMLFGSYSSRQGTPRASQSWLLTEHCISIISRCSRERAGIRC